MYNFKKTINASVIIATFSVFFIFPHVVLSQSISEILIEKFGSNTNENALRFLGGQQPNNNQNQIPAINTPSVFIPETGHLDILNDIILNTPTIKEVRSGAIQSNLVVSKKPEYPGPNELVEISIKSHITDLKRADISWYVNGRLKESGEGLFHFSFFTENIGSINTVKISVKTFEGIYFERIIVFRIANVDLLWEAKTHTPPFYKGRPLASHESEIRIVAIANFVLNNRNINPKNLLYVWREGGVVNEKASGFGKDTYYANTGIPFNTLDVSVEVISRDEKITAINNIKIKTIDPRIVFYKKSPLEGILFNMAIPQSLSIPTLAEVEIVSEPYFASKKGFSHKWYMNNKELTEKSRSLVIRNVQGFGISNIMSIIKNPIKTFQTTNNDIIINMEDNVFSAHR